MKSSLSKAVKRVILCIEGKRLREVLIALANEINVSTGTAAVLGLDDIMMETAPTTAYLMLGGRCTMNCAFCAQARGSEARAINLSRVTWPPFDEKETIKRLAEAVERGDIRRCCLQVTVTGGYFQRTLETVRAIKRACSVPIDAAVLPRDMVQVEALMEAGVDHIGFGLDAACERVFRQVKGGRWARSLALIDDTLRRFPDRAAVHLIVGLGETEREMAEAIQRMHDRGVTVGLFAFTPLRGTAMQDVPPPPLSVYRRMQAARYLISNDQARVEDFTFSAEGRLTSFNVLHWREFLTDGQAFRTSGCPDCNRPYYNERPGGVMYNYPRPLTPAEVEKAIEELED